MPLTKAGCSIPDTNLRILVPLVDRGTRWTYRDIVPDRARIESFILHLEGAAPPSEVVEAFSRLRTDPMGVNVRIPGEHVVSFVKEEGIRGELHRLRGLLFETQSEAVLQGVFAPEGLSDKRAVYCVVGVFAEQFRWDKVATAMSIVHIRPSEPFSLKVLDSVEPEMEDWARGYLAAPRHRWILANFRNEMRFDDPRRLIALARTCLRPRDGHRDFDSVFTQAIKGHSLLDHEYLTQVATALVRCMETDAAADGTADPEGVPVQQFRELFEPTIGDQERVFHTGP
jgi:hypothetical protein